MSRAPVSASGRGEPPSGEAGHSSWGAAADSSASRMHLSTPWSGARRTSACHSTGCSRKTKHQKNDQTDTDKTADNMRRDGAAWKLKLWNITATCDTYKPSQSREAGRQRSKRWTTSWKALPWSADWSRSSGPPPQPESTLACESACVVGMCAWACEGGWKTALWGSPATERGSHAVERTGSLLGRSAGGRLGNCSQPTSFGFFLPPDGNSRAGRTRQIWHRGRTVSERGQKTRAASFCFRWWQHPALTEELLTETRSSHFFESLICETETNS